MENTEILRKYELMVIVDARLPEDSKEAIYKEVMDVVNKSGGRVINSQVWMEKHKLTFEIKKHKEGTYYLINIEGDGSINKKIDATLKLNEKVLRFSLIKID